MRKLQKFLLLVFVAVSSFGCKDPEISVTYTLDVDQTSLSFVALGGTQEIIITSNTDWSISTNGATWITTNPISGSANKTVEITAQENESDESRETLLTFSANGVDDIEVNVAQYGADNTYISTSIEEDITLNAAETIFSFELTSNVAWAIAAQEELDGEESVADWISFEPAEGSGDDVVEVSVAEYDGLTSRSATVSISSGSRVYLTFAITQLPANDNPDAIIYFEDANILDALIGSSAYHTPSVIDVNGDGAVSYAEAALVTELRLNSDNIYDFDEIKYFTSLEVLYMSYNYISDLDVSYNSELRYISCESNYMRTLKIDNNPKLETVICYDNMLSELDLTNSPLITELNYNNNTISNAKFENSLGLVKLFCYTNEITDLDVSIFPELISLSCFSNSLTTLDVSKNTKLQYFDCSTNNLTTVDVSNCPDIIDFDCRNNKISEVSIIDNSVITGLDCSYNNIESLDVSKSYTLSNLIFGSQTTESGADLICTATINPMQNFHSLGLYGNTNTILEITQGPLEITSTTDIDNIWLSTNNENYSGRYAIGVAPSTVIWSLSSRAPLALEEMFYGLMEDENVDFTKTDAVYVFNNSLNNVKVTGWEITSNNTEHVICAIPLTSTGAIDETIEPTIVFDTTEMEALDMSFTLEFEVTNIEGNHCTVTYIPSDQTAIYNSTIYEASWLEGYTDEEILYIMPLQTDYYANNRIGTTTVTYYYLPSNTLISLVGCGLNTSTSPFLPYTELFRYDFMSATYSSAPANYSYDATKYSRMSTFDANVKVPYQYVEPINAVERLGIR